MEKSELKEYAKGYCSGKIDMPDVEDYKTLVDKFWDKYKKDEADDTNTAFKFVEENIESIKKIHEQNKLKYLRENYVSLMWVRVTTIIMLVSAIVGVLAVLGGSGSKF